MKTEINPTDGPPTIRDLAVVAWRRQRLLAVGFTLPVAEDLARNCAVDLHALTKLVEAGCPPRLAARILAPFGEDPRPC